MKKHIYRTTRIEELKVEELCKAVEGRRIVVGVDVAKEDFVAVIMDGDKEVHATVKWKHPFETKDFVKMIIQLPCILVEVAMEPSGTYGDCLRSLFLDADIAVYRVSPERCHDASEVYDGVPSLHDAKAAVIVSRLHLEGASHPWSLPSEEKRELCGAVKLMEVYDDHFHRNVNRLEGHLSRYWPRS